MNAEELENLFRDSGALLSGHFQLSSGRHSEQYFQCALLLSDTKTAAALGQSVAEKCPASWGTIDTIVGPALGGVIIGHETARALGVRSIFTERKEGEMVLRRGFTITPGETVVIVEDVITTGKSTGEVARLLTALGAKVVGALSIVQRSITAPDIGIPMESLAKLPAESFTPKDCPLCIQGDPVIKPGSRPMKNTAKG
jgi:orotate phosphoribosyltransferase